jgi:hypothetical protein
MKESSLSVISARGALGRGQDESVMFWLGENGWRGVMMVRPRGVPMYLVCLMLAEGPFVSITRPTEVV